MEVENVRRRLTDIEDRRAFPVVWWFDFGDLEEIEHFPLLP